MMRVIHVASGTEQVASVSEVKGKELADLIKSRFIFDWKRLSNTTKIYKLKLEDSNSILGAIGITDWPEEFRVEIKLLACSVENIGHRKVYDRVAGTLIAFTGRLALVRYGPQACISLVPKTNLISHYMKKYKMKYAGWQLYIDSNNLLELLNEYL